MSIRLLPLSRLPQLSGDAEATDALYVRDTSEGADKRALFSQLPFPVASAVVFKDLSNTAYSSADLDNADGVLVAYNGGSEIKWTTPNKLPDNTRYPRAAEVSSASTGTYLGTSDSTILTLSFTLGTNEVPCRIVLIANCDIECDSGATYGNGQLAANGAIYYDSVETSQRGFCTNLYDGLVAGRSRGTFACTTIVDESSSGSHSATMRALGTSSSFSRARNRSLCCLILPT